ncbi:MAG: NAD(P)/FAD-dependent oxidoreductase [Candidatus Helarchaeota archaeon]
MNQEIYDIVIVGAGPAGSTAAKLIAEEGFKVLLIDKAVFPRFKPCGGALTRRIVERFPYIASNLKTLTDTEIFGAKIYSPSLKYSTELESDKPLGYMVYREKFDFELVKMAIESGVEFWDDYQISNIIFEQKLVGIISETGEEVKCKAVIGADGVRSFVAKKANLNPGWKLDQIGVCILKEFDIDKKLRNKLQKIKESVHIYVGFENIYGYAWMFIKKFKVNIGIGCLLSEKKNNLKNIFLKYIDLLKSQNYISDLKIEDLKGGLIPLKLPLKKTYGNKVLLIGDAAGFVNSLSGEGLYYALSSGEIAAKTCIELLKNNKSFSEKNLKKYQKSWTKDFGKELKGILFLRRFTRIWLDGIIKYANLDEKWRKMIMNVMLGLKNISKFKLAWRYFWCRNKFWIIDMFNSVMAAITWGFTFYVKWGLRRLHQFYTKFIELTLKVATFNQNKIQFKELDKKELKIWEDIYKIINEPKLNKDENIFKFVFSKFKVVLNSFINRFRIVINSF